MDCAIQICRQTDGVLILHKKSKTKNKYTIINKYKFFYYRIQNCFVKDDDFYKYEIIQTFYETVK